MAWQQVFLIDAFTEEPLSGNRVGVVPNADGLDDSQLLAIATELGASETAFLFDSSSADYRVRSFNQTTEVEVHGHATMALLHHVSAVDGFGEGSFETKEGEIEVTVRDDGTFWMTQGTSDVDQIDLEIDRVSDALGIPPLALDVADLPLALASTGVPFLIVPVRLLENLLGAEPDMIAIEALSSKIDAVGLFAFTFDTLEADSTLHARVFAPFTGVPEDPLTGRASGAAGAYLRRFEAFDTMPDELVFEQGHSLDRPGFVSVRVGTTIQVGGRAVRSLEGRIRVPESDTDEIIEA